MANQSPVRLELRLPGRQPVIHEVTAAEFLLGSVPGCDLVIPGDDLPPVLGVIARTADGIRLRKLAPNLKLLLNGKPVHHASLTNGDTIQVGGAELLVHLAAAPAPVAVGAASSKPWQYVIPLTPAKTNGSAGRPTDTSGAMRQMQQEAERLKEKARELDARQKALDKEEKSRRSAWAERESQLEAELDTARERRREAGLPDSERTEFARSVAQHREDLARLDRQRGDLEKREADLAARAADLTSKVEQVERDAPILEERSRQLDAAAAQLKQDQDAVRRTQAEMELVRTQLNGRGAENERQATMLQALDARLEKARGELGIQAQAQAEQRSRMETLERDLAGRQQQLKAQEATLFQREQAQAGERSQLDERQATVQNAAVQLKGLQETLTAHDVNLKKREGQYTADQQALEAAVQEHREDLARLDRLRDAVEAKEAAFAARVAEVEERGRRFDARTAELDARARQLADLEARLAAEQEQARQMQAEFEAGTSHLAAQTATTEGQQSFLVALRARLERLREELRLEAQNLTDQRARQETAERELAERQRQLDARKAEVEALELSRATERKQVEERTSVLQAAMDQMRALQDRLTAQEAELMTRSASVDSQSAGHTEHATTLKAKAAQLLEIQKRIEVDRNALAAREQSLADAEQARRELQEQLHRRSDELATKQKSADERTAELKAQADALTTDRAALDARADALQAATEHLRGGEAELVRQRTRLKVMGRAVAAARKARAAAAATWDEEHRAAAEDLAHTRAELDEFRAEALDRAGEIGKILPELENRSQAALERLAQAREQLRGHVAELHEYARQSQADLDELRGQVQAETERMVEQQAGLAKARADHRLAVTAFRQQLIDWQGRVAEMKYSLANDGTRLDRKATELDQAARHIERQAADLHAAEEQVAKKRGEVEYHLADMRDYFRRKLRELAETSGGRTAGDEDAAILPSGLTGEAIAAENGQPAMGDAEDVVSITQDLDPADRKLGELLRSLDLVDNETLTALLLEARRQRRSLRQVLLASGKLTVYQMALIEAGNVDGLTVGPFGIIDRLRTTPVESVYRVIDPRPGEPAGPVVLRHLSEAAASDAVRPDEFRQRFTALAGLRHPHVTATIEVLDVAGRPAVLQEWLAGVPSADWPSLAASPGVWYRLSCQALLGLATAHQAGLVHGLITPASVVLSADGLVKLSGVGEPPWLGGADPAATPAGDVQALGKLAAAWAALTPRRKLAKGPRPLPAAVRAVLDRWAAGEFAAAAEVLEALDAAGAEVPAGVETWERLMKYAGENATEGVAWRKSA